MSVGGVVGGGVRANDGKATAQHSTGRPPPILMATTRKQLSSFFLARVQEKRQTKL